MHEQQDSFLCTFMLFRGIQSSSLGLPHFRPLLERQSLRWLRPSSTSNILNDHDGHHHKQHKQTNARSGLTNPRQINSQAKSKALQKREHATFWAVLGFLLMALGKIRRIIYGCLHSQERRQLHLKPTCRLRYFYG